MKNLINWFEILTEDANRAATFYNAIFDFNIKVSDCGIEKIGMFPNGCGAISQSKEYKPGVGGVLIYFDGGDNLSKILSKIETAGGKILVPKTKIGVEGAGYFALFTDTEGNRLGLHSKV